MLANCAMAGSLSWKHVPSLPFELAFLPARWSRWLDLPAERYASPLAIAVGLAKFHHRPPRNPLTRLSRRWASSRALAMLSQTRQERGGFLDSIPVTSFIVMALASMGHAHLPVVRRGVEFLFASLRSDGSWPLAGNAAILSA
jgi:squalene-hopene/tetraprenyl-beta-curcumene cyclase